MFCCFSFFSKMKTDLELALECAINIYHQYAIKNPRDDYLSKSEFTQLMKETAKTFLTNTVPVRAELFKETDLNKDKELSFEEFTIVLSKVADDAHRIIHGENRCKPESN
uniref:EF-hand domain-containing protein n=2 Tax=Anser TaxID=8842 RepID=A0A8B9B819_9AVES